MLKVEEKLNNTSFATRANSKAEYHYPEVTIDNLASFDRSITDDLRSEIPGASKRAVLAFSDIKPLKREVSSK